jgi:hypothetical protein
LLSTVPVLYRFSIFPVRQIQNALYYKTSERTGKMAKPALYERLQTEGFPWHKVTEYHKNGQPKVSADAYQFGVRFSLKGYATLAFTFSAMVNPHVLSSLVALRFPAIWGKAAFTMLVSSTSMNAASETATAMIQALILGYQISSPELPEPALIEPSSLRCLVCHQAAFP